jgi:hypothetical protein
MSFRTAHAQVHADAAVFLFPLEELRRGAEALLTGVAQECPPAAADLTGRDFVVLAQLPPPRRVGKAALRAADGLRASATRNAALKGNTGGAEAPGGCAGKRTAAEPLAAHGGDAQPRVPQRKRRRTEAAPQPHSPFEAPAGAFCSGGAVDRSAAVGLEPRCQGPLAEPADGAGAWVRPAAPAAAAELFSGGAGIVLQHVGHSVALPTAPAPSPSSAQSGWQGPQPPLAAVPLPRGFPLPRRPLIALAPANETAAAATWRLPLASGAAFAPCVSARLPASTAVTGAAGRTASAAQLGAWTGVPPAHGSVGLYRPAGQPGGAARTSDAVAAAQAAVQLRALLWELACGGAAVLPDACPGDRAGLEGLSARPSLSAWEAGGARRTWVCASARQPWPWHRDPARVAATVVCLRLAAALEAAAHVAMHPATVATAIEASWPHSSRVCARLAAPVPERPGQALGPGRYLLSPRPPSWPAPAQLQPDLPAALLGGTGLGGAALGGSGLGRSGLGGGALGRAELGGMAGGYPLPPRRPLPPCPVQYTCQDRAQPSRSGPLPRLAAAPMPAPSSAPYAAVTQGAARGSDIGTLHGSCTVAVGAADAAVQQAPHIAPGTTRAIDGSAATRDGARGLHDGALGPSGQEGCAPRPSISSAGPHPASSRSVATEPDPALPPASAPLGCFDTPSTTSDAARGSPEASGAQQPAAPARRRAVRPERARPAQGGRGGAAAEREMCVAAVAVCRQLRGPDAPVRGLAGRAQRGSRTQLPQRAASGAP